MRTAIKAPTQNPPDESLSTTLTRGCYGFFVLAACCLGIACYTMEAPPVSAAKRNRIHAGMTLAQVEAILSRSDHANRRTDGSLRRWTFSHPLLWQVFHVNFDQDERVVDTELDR